jgi:hypothetical protein
MSNQRRGACRIAQQQRHDRVLAGQCVKAEPNEPSLEARNHQAKMPEQGCSGRAVHGIDRLKRSSLCVPKTLFALIS